MRIRPKRFQMGGGAGGTYQPNPAALQAAQAQALSGQPAVNAAIQRSGLSPQGFSDWLQQQGGGPLSPQQLAGAGPGGGGGPQANPLAQQLAARGAMPTGAPGAGATSSFGPAAPGGMPPPGGAGMPVPAGVGGPGGGAPGSFMPRPGMGWGAPPGGGPMGTPPGGGTAMGGAGVAPGMPPGGPGQQQALMGALAGRGAGAPGAGMPGASPAGSTFGAAPGMNPQVAAMLARNPGLAGAGMGFAEGGEVKTVKNGRVSKFNSTKAAPGNLATHPGTKKLAKGGVLKRKPLAAKKESKVAPPPVYDQPSAGDGGQPPTPNFTGAPGPNAAAMPGMAEGGKWIDKAIKKPGALHAQLGVPKGEKIPEKKLAKAAKAPGKLGERARLAETLKGMKKAKGGECDDKKMRKGGECEKMAAGGAAKQRKGFPNTTPPPKRMASGGEVRGSGCAQRGTRFSGIY